MNFVLHNLTVQYISVHTQGTFARGIGDSFQAYHDHEIVPIRVREGKKYLKSGRSCGRGRQSPRQSPFGQILAFALLLRMRTNVTTPR